MPQYLILTLGNKMPTWVTSAFVDYQKRMPARHRILLQEIPLIKRSKNTNHAAIMAKEAEKMLAYIKPNDFVVALSITGVALSTEQLSDQLNTWQQHARCVFLIGGPEGLHPQCLKRAQFQWSLSKLTFPHPLARIVVAEQLYRAHTILQDHPYHK